MLKNNHLLLVFACVLSLSTTTVRGSDDREILGAAATVHPLATQAALDTLEDGGNAIDAAVSAALMLNVVNGYNSGIGGGCFLLIRLADGTLIAIDGRETAPAAATSTMFLVDGKADTELSQTGPLASGVPGALAAYELAVKEHGRLPLSRSLRNSAQVAELGFVVDRSYASALARSSKSFVRFASSRENFFNEAGKIPRAGEVFHQPNLAETFRNIANHGSDWFYRGPFAEKCAKWMQQNGGLLTAKDFASYKPLLREPIVTTFRDYQIVGFPPPSSGGVHVAQILNIIEQFELAALEESDRTHVIAEAMKLAFADRAFWLGDPDFAKVPRGLIDKQYGQFLAKKIDLAKATDVPQHNLPPDATSDLFGKKHTTHIATMDSEGNWVALTATINTTFGSKVVIPGTGVVMNNEMDDFSAQPGVPNAFGLIGAEANKVEPGKRPLSSMSPTIVLRDGKPIFNCGAAGGPKIITQVVLALVNHLELGMSPAEAIATPRIHHQWRPDKLLMEQTNAAELKVALKARGHTIEESGSVGISQAIGLSEDGAPLPASDPRTAGAAGIARRYAEAVERN